MLFLQDYCALQGLLMKMNFTLAVAPHFVHPMTSLPATPTHSVRKYGFFSEPIGRDKWRSTATYRSVPHIRPPFCNLSASRKRGLYAGSDILSCEYVPSSGARLDVYIGTLHYKSWFDTDLPSLLLSSRNSMVKID